MIQHRWLSSAFSQWEDFHHSERQLSTPGVEMGVIIGVLKDKETLQPVTTAYHLGYSYRISIYGEVKDDVLFTAKHDTIYFINFESGKAVLEDFYELFDDSNPRMAKAWKNRIRNTGLQDCPELLLERHHVVKPIENLFHRLLPQYNLR